MKLAGVLVAPLAAKWHVAGCPDVISVRTATELVGVDRKAKKLVRRDLATGAMLLPLPLALKDGYVAMATGDTVVLMTRTALTGVDAATGKKRWSATGTRAIRLADDLAVATEAGRFEVSVDAAESSGIIGGSGKFVMFSGKRAYDLGTITVAAPPVGH